MRRFKKVCLSFFLPLLFVACGASKNDFGGKKKILATTSQVADLVKEVAGSRVEVMTLIRGEMDPHSYEIVKGDREKFERADLILYSGLGLEHGASLASILSSSPKALALGDAIAASYPEKILKKGESIDPHIWMDTSLWEKGIHPLVEALSRIDPESSEFYRNNGELLSKKMESIHEEIRLKIGQVPSEKRYLVTSHDAFHYFTRAYLAEEGEKNWAERFKAPEGLAPEGQLSSFDIQKVIDFIKVKKVSVLFPESNISRDSIRKIVSVSHELGMDVRVASKPLYGDSMGGLSYLEMMQKNAETISDELCH